MTINPNFNLHVSNGGDGSVTFVADGAIVQIPSDHANFKRIVHALAEGNDPTKFINVFDPISQASDRVTVDENGAEVFFDGEPIHNGVTRTILRYHQEGRDVDNLVRFLERAQANPSRHSREQLWSWVQGADLHVADDGRIVAWKSVEVVRDDIEADEDTDGSGESDEAVETYRSHSSGTAWVNGVEFNGKIPYAVGDVVTIPRELVEDDPSTACSHGLHIGTFDYASNFGGRDSKILEVAVAPEDVVSVPNDSRAAKIRCAQFEVLAVQDRPTPDLSHYEPEATEEEFDEDAAQADIERDIVADEIQKTFLGRLWSKWSQS